MRERSGEWVRWRKTKTEMEDLKDDLSDQWDIFRSQTHTHTEHTENTHFYFFDTTCMSYHSHSFSVSQDVCPKG